MTQPATNTKHVWITGASSGIGEAVAYEYAARNASLTLSSRTLDELQRVADQCKELGATGVEIAQVDITDLNSVRTTVASIEERQAIDVALLNAGIWKKMRAQHFDAEEFARQYDVNVVGTANCLEPILKAMIERDRGLIVFVSSLTAYTGIPLASAYGSSKAALMSLSESIRADLGGTGVKVTTIYPGFVRTAMTEVNKFPMPGLMDVDVAARKIVRGIERGNNEISFPRGLATMLYALRIAPSWIRLPIKARMVKKRRRR